MDTLVLDLETQNFFTDQGVGWNNFQALKISVLGVYSYSRDKYFCFEESELEKAAELFRDSRLLVGFSINSYDLPVLECYFKRLEAFSSFNLWEKERFDLLEEIELANGRKVSLDNLARANLGFGKERPNWEAPELYKNGQLAELKNYCLKDVEITKNLYELYRRQTHLLIPDKKTGEIRKVFFNKSNAASLL